MHRFGSSRRRTMSVLLVSTALLAAGCGGEKSEKAKPGTTAQTRESLRLTAQDGESGLAEAGEPQRGGKVIYGLEAESAAGYCLSESQLAISGLVVARALYDTLTIPNADGGFSPYLAESVTPNENHTEWTVTLREGIKFHDGSDLDATVVKNNLDAFRGTYPGRPSLLFSFVLQEFSDVQVKDSLTLVITTKRPWVSVDAILYASGRLGIMAQAQLDAPGDACATHPIGTGPFEFVSWTKNQKLTAKRNPDYWQIAPDGEPYPYLDEIEFRPIPDATVRANALDSGDITALHAAEEEVIKNSLRPLRDDGKVNLLVSDESAEVNFIQLNSSIPPFNDPRMRKALAHAANRPEAIRRVRAGLPRIATGPFGPGSIGYLDDAGFPDYDPAAARKLIAEYRADSGDDGSFTYTATADPAAKRTAEWIQRDAAKVGLKVTIQSVDQSALVDRAIAGDFQAMGFRNFPGGDPDQNYAWWYGDGNLVNFGRWNDVELNRLLDAGRETADPAEREKIYQDVNRIMASEVYGLWTSYAVWAVAVGSDVHGILGPPLPGDDPSKAGAATVDDPKRQPSVGLATAHSLLGLWVEH